MGKYMTEFGLNVFASEYHLLEANQLNDIENDHGKYHIYFILSSGRIFTKTDMISSSSDGISITFYEMKNGNEIKYEPQCVFKILPDLDHSKIELTCHYPYQTLDVTINDEAFLSTHKLDKKQTIPIQAVFDLFREHLRPDRIYDVLYVGQSYGCQGNRNAVDRLSSHSTFQNILADCQGKYPNNFIYVMLLEMTHRLITSIDGITKTNEKSDEEDNEHIARVFSNLPLEEQVINITEAAMINFFKPTYNVMFVENFPCQEHKSYRQYYDLDYRDICIEICLTPQVHMQSEHEHIFSSSDMIRYDLHNDPNRFSMYDIFKAKENS